MLAIATLGSIAAAAIALFGWFLALGYLGVLASLWVGIEIADNAE